jgi:hypothetical protein
MNPLMDTVKAFITGFTCLTLRFTDLRIYFLVFRVQAFRLESQQRPPLFYYVGIYSSSIVTISIFLYDQILVFAIALNLIVLRSMTIRALPNISVRFHSRKDNNNV